MAKPKKLQERKTQKPHPRELKPKREIQYIQIQVLPIGTQVEVVKSQVSFINSGMVGKITGYMPEGYEVHFENASFYQGKRQPSTTFLEFNQVKIHISKQDDTEQRKD